MKIYHTTYFSKEILSHGFKDATGNYMTDQLRTGVWFSNIPIDINGGADGDVVLMMHIPARKFIEYEWVEEDEEWRESKRYREALILAEIVNKYGLPTVVDENDLLNKDFEEELDDEDYDANDGNSGSDDTTNKG